jgi:hypothetical protein
MSGEQHGLVADRTGTRGPRAPDRPWTDELRIAKIDEVVVEVAAVVGGGGNVKRDGWKSHGLAECSLLLVLPRARDFTGLGRRRPVCWYPTIANSQLRITVRSAMA